MSAGEWSGRWSGRVESDRQRPAEQRRPGRTNADDFSRATTRGSRLSRRRLSELADDLSERDRAVLDALRTVRVLTGSQLERLLFGAIATAARGRVRRRVLGRLGRVGLVETLTRRVGGVRAGSSGLVYALTAAGQRLLDLVADPTLVRRRAAYTPSALFLAHMLAVSEVYVGLSEVAAVDHGWALAAFAVEGDARWAADGVEMLRPDALVALATEEVEDVWWLEVDRGTESLPRLRTMAERYLAFAHSGEPGPRGVVPRVAISVESDERLYRLRGLVRRLPAPASELFVVCRDDDTVGVLVDAIRSTSSLEPP
ncbi:MAG TPA: replication-relaxation family protein [Thermomicrobiales bacterium]|nr:replication-relaxation family protein [Thermomicrobiales bacterium]